MKIRLLMSYSRWLPVGKRLVGSYSRRPLTFERLSARTSLYVCCCCWERTENCLTTSLSSLSTVYTVHHPRHQGRWTTYWPIVSTLPYILSSPLPQKRIAQFYLFSHETRETAAYGARAGWWTSSQGEEKGGCELIKNRITSRTHAKRGH